MPPNRRPPSNDQPGTSAPNDPPEGAISPWVRLRSANRHPFIYARMVRDVDPAARPGDVVNIYDKSGRLFGRGLFNPHSTIRLRVLTHDDRPVDEAFWRSRLAAAVELRNRLGLTDVTDACRLVHAEGDGLSGLIVERYADCMVFEIFSLGVYRRVEPLAGTLTELLEPPSRIERPDRAGGGWKVVVRADESIQRAEGFTLEDATVPGFEPGPPSVTIREHGVRYRVEPRTGHKTGFFCDQRDNRSRFAGLCRDADVLDLCCYTGGFGLCAKVLGQAREVTAVDLDENAIAAARQNANLNQVRIQFAHSDAFIYLRQMNANERQYDCVVLDPPKLAVSRDAVDEALRKYSDLNALAFQVVRPGGFLTTCSCSGLVSWDRFTDTVRHAAHRARVPIQILGATGAGPDHPVLSTCPESEYLKVLWLRVLPG